MPLWVEIVGGPILLEPGTVYRGCVKVSAWSVVTRALLTPARLKEGLEEEGFFVNWCSSEQPADRMPCECFRYVQVTYLGPRRWRDRPEALALAWRLER